MLLPNKIQTISCGYHMVFLLVGINTYFLIYICVTCSFILSRRVLGLLKAAIRAHVDRHSGDTYRVFWVNLPVDRKLEPQCSYS